MAKFKSFLERELRKYNLWEKHSCSGNIKIDGAAFTVSELYSIFKDYNQWAYSADLPGTWAAFMMKLSPYISYQELQKTENTIPFWVHKISEEYHCTYPIDRVSALANKLLQSDKRYSHSARIWAAGLIYYSTGKDRPTQKDLSQKYRISEVTIRKVVKELEVLESL